MQHDVTDLADEELLSRTIILSARNRRAEAELVAHVAEVDHRRLYLQEACPSMFVYCTTRLGMSEAEAYLRITVGRASRRFSSILPMLGSGRVHLSAVARLAAHLTEDNAAAILARAAGRSRREVDAIVAELAPKPDVPPSIRRLPRPPAPEASGELRLDRVAAAAGAPAAGAPAAGGELCLDRVAASAHDSEAAPTVSTPAVSTPAVAPPAVATPAVAPSAPPLSPASPPAMIVPIAPARFKVQFTASSELEAKLARATALLRHQIPSGDLAAVIDHALTELLAKLERKKCAATSAPRRSLAESDYEPVSRNIPAAVRRMIWQRDEGQCTFVDRHGRRCAAREKLEFHHEVPYARGGDHGPDNVRLLCRAHNTYRAELDYGREIIRQKIETRRSTASRSPRDAPRSAKTRSARGASRGPPAGV